MRDGDLSPVISLEEASYTPVKYPGVIQHAAERLHAAFSSSPRLLSAAESINRKLSSMVLRKQEESASCLDSREQLYRTNARLRAESHCGYIYAERCRSCSLKQVCDGFHGDYAALFGADEATCIELPQSVDDPKHFIGSQWKVVEEEDFYWAL